MQSTPLLVPAFFCAFFMELILILFALWILACACLGLLWHIHTLNENMYWEREDTRKQIIDLIAKAEDERRNLYDRIMAGTLPQFKEHEAGTPNEVEPEEDEVIPLEDAREEIMNG